jgi:hypothetical protein
MGPPALEGSPTIEHEPYRNPETPEFLPKIKDKQSLPKGQATKPADLVPEGMLAGHYTAAHPFFTAAGRNIMMLTAPVAAGKNTKSTDETIALPTQHRSLKPAGNRREKKGGRLFKSLFR